MLQMKIGDKVSHPSFGGCVISDIKAEEIDFKMHQCLVLALSNESNMHILIPMENVEKIGIRDIISESYADKLLNSFSSLQKKVVLEGNKDKKRQAYVNVIKQGTLDDLAALIQELTLHMKPCSGDKELLPVAQRKLFSEISLAKNWDFQRVLEYALTRMKPEASRL